MTNRLTIASVARSAGVSSSTVSNVLNGRHEQMAAETLLRVQGAIEQLGYRPNHLARSLVTRRTATVGLVVYKLTHSLYPPIIPGAEDILRRQGYGLLLAHAPDVDAERRAIDLMCSKKVDGLLVFSVSALDMQYEHLLQAQRDGTPVVVINRHVPEGVPFSQVNFDNFGGARAATRHLLELGHRRIGFVAGPPTRLSYAQRLAGYRAALDEAGIALDERLMVHTRDDESDELLETGGRLMRELWQARPSGVFVAHDFLAVGALRAIGELGLRIREDVSLVAFCSRDFARFSTPALTAVEMPVMEAGRQAAELVLRRIVSPDEPVETRTLDMELVAGETSASPAARGSDGQLADRVLDSSAVR